MTRGYFEFVSVFPHLLHFFIPPGEQKEHTYIMVIFYVQKKSRAKERRTHFIWLVVVLVASVVEVQFHGFSEPIEHLKKKYFN